VISEYIIEPTIWIVISTLLGLCTGSFLNVLIHRLPIMMERQWEDELDQANEKPLRERKRFNLFLPHSHCPKCNNHLKWWQNIPVLSFLLLRGKCHYCATNISWRYPIIEIFTAAAFAFVAWQYPAGWQGLAWMGFVAALIALAMIDLDTCFLPDVITLPLMWAGILFNLITQTVSLEYSVLGAVAGYMILWFIYHVFKLITGKEGMGFGDFKLLAAGGAWIGVHGLLSVLTVASVIGVIFGLAIQFIRGKSMSSPFPFGPSIVIALFSWLLGLNIAEFLY
jgi:leader peptidase (prepilin peptidase) / N-methyltransferase